MCLAVPGKILHIDLSRELALGTVDFGGIQKLIHLAYTPEAKVGDYVLTHVGFAIKVLSEEKAIDLFANYQGKNESI